MEDRSSMTVELLRGMICTMRVLAVLLVAGCGSDFTSAQELGGAAGAPAGGSAGQTQVGGAAGVAGQPAGGSAGSAGTIQTGGAGGTTGGGTGGSSSTGGAAGTSGTGGAGGGACVPKTFEEVCAVNECGMFKDGCSSVFVYVCGSCNPVTEACEQGQCVPTACQPKLPAQSSACANNTPGTPVLWSQCTTQPGPGCVHTIWVPGSADWCCPA